jgi:hypothetical protein
MKKWLIIGVIIFVILTILAAIFWSRGEDISPEASCKVNSDCVKFENPCCSCSNGGTAYSVNKEYVEEVKSKINNGCSQISDYCPMPEVFQDMCSYSVKCWDGMCGFEGIDPREQIIVSGNYS